MELVRDEQVFELDIHISNRKSVYGVDNEKYCTCHVYAEQKPFPSLAVGCSNGDIWVRLSNCYARTEGIDVLYSMHIYLGRFGNQRTSLNLTFKKCCLVAIKAQCSI